MENQPEINKDQEIEPAASNSGDGQINQEKLNQYLERLRLEQNLPLAIIAGAAACLVGAVTWAFISVSTGYQIGYMALAIGFLVGFSVRYAGKGIDKTFGFIGASFSLLGCLIGNFFSVIAFTANSEDMSFLDTFSAVPVSMIPGVMMDTFSFMDILFYGIALYEGFKFSFRVITEEELAKKVV